MTAYRCGDCGVVYLDPHVTVESMMQIYASPEALAEHFPFCDNYFEDSLAGNRKTPTWKVWQEQLSRLEKATSGRRLLDAGCGSGQFLELARERGWQAEGLEFDNSNLARLREKGLTASSGDFLTWRGTGEPYDVITLWDVFEHFPDPQAALNQARRLLRRGGLLLIASPREDSLLGFIVKTVWRLFLGRFEYPAKVVYLLDHPLFYTPRSLTSLLSRQGFRTERLSGDETDLGRVHFGRLMKLALRLLFILSRWLGMQNRLIAVARKA